MGTKTAIPQRVEYELLESVANILYAFTSDSPGASLTHCRALAHNKKGKSIDLIKETLVQMKRLLECQAIHKHGQSMFSMHLSYSQFDFEIVKYMWEVEGRTLTEIGQQHNVSRHAAAGYVRRLQEKGLLKHKIIKPNNPVNVMRRVK
jgi:hypothetical protein